jgi:putative oxidoreductase
MILGLGTRLAGLALTGDMVMAMITVTWAHGINSQSLNPGYELNLALGALALVVVLLGPGRFSLDALLARGFAVRPRRSESEAVDFLDR